MVVKPPDIKFHEYPFGVGIVTTCGWADGVTDI